MKKIFLKKSILFVLFATFFILGGCSNKDENSSETSPHKKNPQEKEKQVKVNTETSNAFDYLFSNIKDEYKNEKNFQKCLEKSTHSCLRSSVEKKVVQEKNADFCEDIILDKNKNDCKRVYLTKFAKEQKNPALCEKISDEYGKNFCRAEFVIAQAIQEKSPEKCSTLGSLKNSCVSSVVSGLVEQSPEKKWCDFLTEGEQKKHCEEQVSALSGGGIEATLEAEGEGVPIDESLIGE